MTTTRRFKITSDPKEELEQEIESIATLLVPIAGLARFPAEVLNEDTLERIAAYLKGEIDTHVATVRIELMKRGLGRSRFSLDAPVELPKFVQPTPPMQRQIVHLPHMPKGFPPAQEAQSVPPGAGKILGKLVGSKETGEIIVIRGEDPPPKKRVSPKEVPDKTGGIQEAGFIDD